MHYSSLFVANGTLQKMNPVMARKDPIGLFGGWSGGRLVKRMFVIILDGDILEAG